MTLATYMFNNRETRFAWGRNDCLTFVSGALEAQGLAPLPREWVGTYTTPEGALRHYKRLLIRTGNTSIISAMDDLYDRPATLHPADGMIAARSVAGDVLGWAFGVVFRGGFAALHEGGLVNMPLRAGDLFWVAE